MAGDPLRDAFRAKLLAIVGSPPAGSFAGWVISDTLNTTEAPDAAVNFITLRFGPASEQQYSFGAPGANLWKEAGDVYVDFFARLGNGHDQAEVAALALRNAFRTLGPTGFAMTTGQRVRILEVAPMFGGPVDGAWWCETVAIAYRVFNTG